MRVSKNILSILCLLALLTSFAVFGVDHIHRASQAAEADCTVCVDCDVDEHGVSRACCMGTERCKSPDPGLYACDGYYFNCDGDIVHVVGE